MKHCSKCGKEIDSGYLICSDCLKSERAADEMFAELGYEIDSINTSAPYPYYTNCCGVHIEICPVSDGISKYENVYGYGVRFLPFTIEEFKAVAKKLEELGW